MGEANRGFLIDTSIWLELLLEQYRADESAALVKNSAAGPRLSEFTLYSIGLSLTRRGQGEDFFWSSWGSFIDRSLKRVRLRGGELLRLPEAMEEFRLDFDRTDLERLEPADVLDQSD